jgi:hypothetical protein
MSVMMVVLATSVVAGAPISNVVVVVVVVATGLCEGYGTQKTGCWSLVIGMVMVCIAVTEIGTCNGCSCCSGIHGVANYASTINKSQLSNRNGF